MSDLPALAAVVATIAKGLDRPIPAAFADIEPGVAPQGVEEFGIDDIGPFFESLTAERKRKTRGVHFTDRVIAEHIVELAFTDSTPERPTILDPSVGGGAFLLAAGRHLASRGEDPADIAPRLHGIDIDPVAARVADATIELWSGARPRITVADSLTSALAKDWPDRFAMVVGNPPFLSQLRSGTARSDERRALLATRFAELASGYVDDAGLFLVRGTQLLADGGTIALILPEAILGAADAAPLRRWVDDALDLRTMWLGGDRLFDASVRVFVPIFDRGLGDRRSEGGGVATTEVHVRNTSGSVAAQARRVDRLEIGDWAGVASLGSGNPVVRLSGTATVSDIANVTAGFRQHYYGLHPAVRESAAVPESTSVDGTPREDEEGVEGRNVPVTSKARPSDCPLVTVGSIDPLVCHWGRRPTRFAKRTFVRPVVDVTAIEDKNVADWFADRLKPKVLIASQTRTVEVIVDESGRCVPSVPVISVEPTNATDIWKLAALFSSSVAAAWLTARSLGTGMSEGTIRVRAKDLEEMPVPRGLEAWNEAAEAAQAAQRHGSDERFDAWRDELARCSELIEAAFGDQMTVAGTADLNGWWLDRLPHLARQKTTAY